MINKFAVKILRPQITFNQLSTNHFISLADGESSTIPGYILNLVNCPKTWRSLSKFLLCCIITAFGSVFFSWLYTAWHFNLYVPIMMHTFMNAFWGMFQIEGVNNSVGNIVANSGRILTIILAILITCWYRKRNGEKIWMNYGSN